jgi:type VI secretion system secreted protein Hcp
MRRCSMKTALLRALVVAGMVLAITSPSQGFEGFLRIDGIKGESTDQRYRDWIVVTAVGWGHQLPVATGPSGGGASVSRTQFQPLTVSKIVDSTSPGLAQMAADGRAIRQVFLDLVQGPGQPPFARLELQEVVITSYAVEGVAGSPQRPVEKLSFRFARINWGSVAVQPDGRPGEVKSGWDLRTNQKF